MEHRRTVSAFLESGPWVPFEVAAPLGHCLQRLDVCLKKTPHAVNPTLAWLVHLKVTQLAAHGLCDQGSDTLAGYCPISGQASPFGPIMGAFTTDVSHGVTAATPG
jgi:hypothetical protein